MSKKATLELPETSQELRKYLDKRNSEARAARRKLKEVEKTELVSAKKALGEAVAGALFADKTDAILALVRVVNKPEIADALRRVFGAAKSIENSASEEPEEDPQWGSDRGDDQDGTSAPQEQW